MQRLSYPTETVLTNKITRNRIVLSFKDSLRKPDYQEQNSPIIQRQSSKAIKTATSHIFRIHMGTFNNISQLDKVKHPAPEFRSSYPFRHPPRPQSFRRCRHCPDRPRHHRHRRHRQFPDWFSLKIGIIQIHSPENRHYSNSTVIGARMSHRKWREIKQHLIL